MITEQQKEIIKNILSPFQPLRIGIFGSVARGDNKAESDLDILVTFQRKYSLFDLVDLQDQLANALDCKIDLVTEASIHPSIKPFIEKDIILIQHAERA